MTLTSHLRGIFQTANVARKLGIIRKASYIYNDERVKDVVTFWGGQTEILELEFSFFHSRFGIYWRDEISIFLTIG